MNAPELVAIGHVTWDVLPETPLNLPLERGGKDGLPLEKGGKNGEPGGAVAFAAVTAARLGVTTGIVTSCGDDYPICDVPISGEMWRRVVSKETSTFENRYDARGDRVQVLHRRGGDISLGNVPEGWSSPEMLFVGPLTQELPVDCLNWFRPRVSCVVPQGWLRSWDLPLPSEVKVSKSPPDGMSSGWDICVISESEVDAATLSKWQNLTRNLVITKGAEGADLYVEGRQKPFKVPSFANSIEGTGVDTTGAGDVFAAAMLVRYAATRDPVESARYASACAALSTRAPSWSAVEAPSFPL